MNFALNFINFTNFKRWKLDRKLKTFLSIVRILSFKSLVKIYLLHFKTINDGFNINMFF